MGLPMTSLLAPFTGFIPSAEHAPRIVGPPTSMISPEQKNASAGDELSFRHRVGRGARAPHSEAMKWLERCLALDALEPVDSAVIVHRLVRGDFTATGLIADVSLAAYDAGRIKRHEATIAKTERKMLDYMRSTRIFGNPVALAHLDHPDIAASLAAHANQPAKTVFESIDGTQHSLWVVSGDDARALCDSFSDVLYITDGHHRLAAASLLATAEGRPDPYLPAGLFAESELLLWAYARAIRDERLAAGDVLGALGRRFDLEESDRNVPRPHAPNEVGVRIDGRSFVLTIPDEMIPTDVYDRLAVNLLRDLVMIPAFGPMDPRTDPRLSFIADTGDAAHDPDSFDAWFLPYPTSVREVMAVADSGRTMPPKSTFFMPKLPSGLAVRLVDTD